MIRRKGNFTGRVLVVALTLAFGAASANAYTIVMRDGRRVEIPDEFTVSGSMLTYETSPGIQVTIQLRTINVDATERANGAARGSFLAHSNNPAPVKTTPAVAETNARRSITNADLEEYRRARIASEKAYERRRRELNLPPVDVQRQEVAAVTERTQEQLRNQRGRQEADEAYWRQRATALRTDIAANEAQIDYVRQRLNELPAGSSVNQFTSIYSLAAMNPFNPAFQVFPPFNRRRFNRFVQPNFLTMPYQNYDYSYERQTLTTQLNDLQMQRAALQVRWREFEEEARHAGVYPGWLRP